MLITGFHAVSARLKRSPESVKELYVAHDRRDQRMREFLQLAQAANIHPRTVDVSRLDTLAKGHKHQGIVAIADQEIAAADLKSVLDQHATPLLLLLDGITDPRNLGACLRVADGAGVHAVVAPKDHGCMLTEVAMQTASGAAETVPYILVTNLARALDEIQERGVWVVGTSDQATQDLYQARFKPGLAWVIGAEGKGMRRLTQERCDELVRIPMAGTVSSLNVSVAAGVVLYETVRQFSASAKA
jgi:23S rRNA (guanosine2251-2'-O)-methyltransferase